MTATKSSSTETLYLAPGTCVHKGGWTAGHYRVDVSASGYQPVTDPDVEVVRSDPVCPFIFKTEKTYVLHRQSAASSSGGGSGTSSSGP